MKQSSEILTDVFERITDAFVALDNNWCYTYMNKKAGAIFQRNPAQMIGKHIWTEFPEGIDQTFYKAYHRAMAEQHYIHVEEYYAPYDLWFENHIYPSPQGLSIFFRDITEKKKAEEILNQNRNFIESIINASQDIIYIFDIEERKNVYVNEGMQRNLGYSDVEIKEMGDGVLSLLMHPEDFNHYLQNIFPKYETLKDKEVITNEFRMRHRNGSLHWLFTKESIFLRKPDGSPKQIFGITLDITERKETELKLDRERQKRNLLLNNAHDGIFVLDQDFRVVETNQSFSTMLGLNHEETLRTYPWNWDVNYSTKEILNETWPELPMSVQKFETKLKHKNGNIFDAEITGSPAITEWEGQKLMLFICRDISLQKKAEKNLREASERIASHLNNSPLAVIEWDKNLIIRSWSVQAENIFGWNEAEVINKHFNDFNLVFEEDSKVAVVATELMSGAVDRNKSENRNNTKSGKVIFCQWFNSVLKDEKGKVQSILSLIQDITESKKMDLILTSEKKVLEMIATEKPLDEILNTIALNFEAYSDNALCSIQLLDAEGTHIRHGAGPSLPDAYNKGIDGEPIGPVAGSCGTAAYRKERVIVSDIATDPLWVNYRDFALGFGLKASWSTPIINAEGKVYATFAIYYKECRTPGDTDLTLIDRAVNQVQIVLERYYKDTRIKESEEKYRTLVEQASDAIFIADENGKFITVNTSACKLSGFSEKELLQLSIYDFAILKDIQKNPFHFDELKQGKAVNTERVMKGRDGNSLHVGINAKLLSDGRLLTFVRDITERKKAEEEIKESEERFSSIFKAAPGSMILFSLADGKVVEVNDNFSQITGYTRKEAIGKNTGELGMWVNLADREKYLALLEKQGIVTNFEADLNHKSGTILNGLVSGHIITIQEKKYLLGVFQDITERKKAEEEIKNTTIQLRQLTSHLQTIREEERKRIGREIHDELGQQLTAIKMDVAWIDKKTTGEASPIKSKLKNIITLLDGSNESVRKILSELRPGVLDDYGLVDALEWQGIRFTESTGIPVIFTNSEAAIKLPEQISTCIFRVYQESLTNITRYAQATKVLTSLSIKDECIILTVKDDGNGFDMAAVQSKKTFGILGMKERVLSLNGRFELVSAKGKGTKIVISIPYKD